MNEEWKGIANGVSSSIEVLHDEGKPTDWFRKKDGRLNNKWWPVYNLNDQEIHYISPDGKRRISQSEYFSEVGFEGMSIPQIKLECERIVAEMGKRADTFIYEKYCKRYCRKKPKVFFLEDGRTYQGMIYLPNDEILTFGNYKK